MCLFPLSSPFVRLFDFFHLFSLLLSLFVYFYVPCFSTGF
jgi:hypothetical protein